MEEIEGKVEKLDRKITTLVMDLGNYANSSSSDDESEQQPPF